ncbi:hypothetical protein J3U08_11415 [Gilliamella sp. B2894]|uniref:T6SS effector BTH_I2691 family protein n=1 Tax=unclassified Gilliamella TaxID=2685620 RepID=UPI00226A143D|nr:MULTISPECIES: T6SS effector BTH_I2691 family protein [unclassified Gilliamella]MCX8657397.1 hypothetical protein [Gilliamella sp. B2894]MCX8693480.1 hypothetical protein [Gilliamella sp. B2881]MCX8697230.1 hypothetical protein [Gilliamella sp. B2828]
MTCDCASSKGLTILPVNYCVIPKIEGLNLPNWANQPKITDAKLKYDYSYALRVIREGFLYLFYEEGARGNHYWEVYKIAKNGTFWKQFSAQMATTEEDCGCAAVLQNSASAEFICIEQPQQCGKVWLAFSEHKWENDVLTNYETDNQLRSERMSLIEPKKMAQGSVIEANGIAQLNESNVKQIIDYNEKSILSIIPDPTIKRSKTLVSNDINQWNTAFFNQHCTLYPWAINRQLNHTLNSARERSTEKNSYIVGLNDAAGISKELNGWCNEIIGYLKLFSEEREHEIQSDALLTLFENSFIKANENERREALKIYEELHRQNNYWLEKVTETEGADWLAKRRVQYQKQYLLEPDLLAALNQGCDLFADWMKQPRVGALYYQRLDVAMKEVQSNKKISDYLKKITQLRAKAIMTVQIDETMHKEEVEKITTIPREQWKKYQARINQPLRDTYNKKYEAITQQASLLHEQRSENAFIWIQSNSFLSVLNDYSQNNIEDGILFERLVITAIEGLQDTKKGNQVIGDWIKARNIPKTNLIWRAVAFNQTAAIKELEEFLLDAEKYREVDGNGRLHRTLLNVPKNLSYFTSISRDINSSLQKKKPDINAKFIDKFAYKRDKLASILIGKLFRKQPVRVMVDGLQIGADNINHYIGQKIFMVRAGLEPDIVKSVMNEYYDRRDWITRMKKLNIDNQMFSGPFPNVEQKGLKGQLGNNYLKTYTHNILKKIIIKKNNKPTSVIIKGKYDELWDSYHSRTFGRDLKGTRLSAVLMAFQIPVIMTLIMQTDDHTSDDFLNQIMAASLSFISVFTDVLIKPIDIAFNNTNLVIGLRMTGHLTGAASSIFGLMYAIPQALKSNQDNIELTLNRASVMVYISQFLKASTALLKMSTKLVNRVIIRELILMAGLRIFTFFASWWLQLILIVVEFVWNLIVDDDIQKWIRSTRFGTQYNRDETPDFNTEFQAFKELMKVEDNQEEVEQQSDNFLTAIGWDSDWLSDTLGINSNNNTYATANIPYSIN